ASFNYELETARGERGGAAISDSNVAGQRAGAEQGVATCIVLGVHVLQAPLAAGGDVVGEDRSFNKLECERGRLPGAGLSVGLFARGGGDQFLERVFQVAAVGANFQTDDGADDLDCAQIV